MTRLKTANLARDYGALFGTGTLAGLGDGLLLERFIARRDEVAFEELLARHGPLVLGICRRWLDDPRDVEDAFQATFLILVRKAAALRNRSALSSWIYGVALRVVRRARGKAVGRRIRERPISEEPADRARTPEEYTGDEILATVDEEIRRLPDNQQLAVILCLREGYTHEAAARELGWPIGTVKSRIATARQTLARRLSRRGLAPSGVAAALRPGLGLAERTIAISPHLVRLTLETARDSAASSSIPSAGTSATVAGLVREVMVMTLVTRLRAAALVLMALGTLAWSVPVLLGAREAGKGPPASEPQATPIAAASPSRSPKVDRYGDPLPTGAAMRLGTVHFRDDQYIGHLAYSPDGRFVVTGNGEGRLQVWDARDGKKLRPIDVGVENIRDFAFSPDGNLIATIGFQYEPGRNADAHYLTFIDVATGRPVRRGEWDEKDDTWRMAYAPDGKTVATASGDGTLRLWDVATASIQHQERWDKSRYPAFAFSPDASSHLLAITGEQGLSLWDVANHRHVRKIAIDGISRLRCLAFSPDGMILAAGLSASKGETRLWRVSDGTPVGRFVRTEDAEVYHVAFSPDGKVLAANGHGGWLMLIDVATGKELEPLSGIHLAEGSLAFSPDGRTLATTGGEHVLHLWDVATGEDRLATPEAHLGPVGAFAFLDDGKTLVSGSDDRTVRTWDLATGRPLKSFAQDGWVRSLAVSADGSLLAADSTYPEWGKIHVWNLKTGQRLRVLPANAPKAGLFLRAVALDRDGSSVIAAWGDGSLRRWDVSTGKEQAIAQPRLPKEPQADQRRVPNDVDLAFFSRDARSVGLIGQGRVSVVDLASGEVRCEHPSWHIAGAFAPDGQSLAVVRQGPGKEIKMADGRTRGDSSTASNTIVWLDSRTGQVRREIEIPESRVGCLAFSPDGQAIAAGTSFHWRRGVIRIFRLRDKREIQTIETPCPWMQGLSFTPDGRRIVAGLSDTSIVIWDARPAG
jgi:RNA polymerase sigma factor (sigma-70 family)